MSDHTARIEEARTAWWRTSAGLAFGIVIALTLIRVIGLRLSIIDLYPDEAQYWDWSRHLAPGYFSKPPLIAWLIALTTSACGDGEACIRLASPLLHAGTSVLIYYIALRLYDERTAFWSCISYATLPVVWLSANLITTDVPLVFFWSLALLAFNETIFSRTAGRRPEALRWAALCGAAIGIGLLAKYAMIYFVICACIYLVCSAPARRALLSPAGAIAVLCALLLFAPNLAWNIGSGFVTFKHTAANANWGASASPLASPWLFLSRQGVKAGFFLLSQVGVFGPVLTITYLFGLMTFKRRLVPEHARSDVLLVCFSAPILAIMLAQSIISVANANWAAPAYLAATVLTVSWLLRLKARKYLGVSIAIHTVCGIVLYSLATIPGAIELFAVGDSFKRVRGWDELGHYIERVTANAPYHAIVTDNRSVVAEITYYARGAHIPVVIFDLDNKPENEFELSAPYTSAYGDPVLLVTAQGPESKVAERFSSAEPLSTFRMNQGGKYFTDFHLYELSGFEGNRGP